MRTTYTLQGCKKSLHLLFCVSLTILWATIPVRAAFQNGFRSVRSSALGGIPIGERGDASALFQNPAGMAGMRATEAYFTYSSMLNRLNGVEGFSTGFMSVGIPNRIGTLGLGLGIFNAASLIKERTLSLGFAKSFHKGWQAGFALKQLHHSYAAAGDSLAENDPVFNNGYSKSALSVDAGMIVPLGKILQLGVSIKDMNEPNVGLVTEDRVPRQIQAGAALNAWGIKTTGNLSFLHRSYSNAPSAVPAFGIEKGMYGDRFALRMGMNASEWTTGFGLQMGQVGFEYALVLNQNLPRGNEDSHKIGIRYQFGVRK
jgi:hypothetical protein